MSGAEDLIDRVDRWLGYRADYKDRLDMAEHLASAEKLVLALRDRVDELEVELDKERSGVWP